MQKLIIAGVVVLVLGGGVWYFNQEKPVDTTPVTNETTNETLETDETEFDNPSGAGSFTSLIGLKQNIMCDYSYRDDNGSGSGVGYFTDYRYRIDSTMTTSEGTFESHMINDGDSIYTWTTGDEEIFAIKMPIPEESTSDVKATGDYNMPETDDQNQVTLEQEVEYDCKPWDVDSVVFVPPSTVAFTDMTTMMQEAMQGMPEGFDLPEGVPMVQ